jgi:hypothetical protein
VWLAFATLRIASEMQMATEGFQAQRHQGRPSLIRGRRWKILVAAALVCIVLVIGLLWAAYQLSQAHLAPALPPYPNVVRACYPSRLEAQLMGEAFCGIETRDSYRTVVDYYDAHLPQHGWEKRWYRNPAGICYTLLIIQNDPTYARTPPGVTSLAFKLRQAFYSELNTTAPPGCK